MKHGGALRAVIFTVSRIALRRKPDGFQYVPSPPDLRLFDTLNTYISSIFAHNGKLYDVRVGTSSMPDDVKTPWLLPTVGEWLATISCELRLMSFVVFWAFRVCKTTPKIRVTLILLNHFW